MAKKTRKPRTKKTVSAPSAEAKPMEWKTVHNAADFDSNDDVEAQALQIQKEAKNIFKNMEGTSEWENAKALMTGINDAVINISNDKNSMDDDVQYLNVVQRCFERLEIAKENAFEVQADKKKK